MLKGSPKSLKYTGKVRKDSNYFRVIPQKKNKINCYISEKAKQHELYTYVNKAKRR